jgi:hypothetical protein
MQAQRDSRGQVGRRSRRLDAVRRMFQTVVSIVVALIALQVSGLGAMAEYLDRSTETSGGCCSDCPMEQDGRECPPGCPNCHCAHGGVGLPMAHEGAEESSVLEARMEVPPYEATVPRAPPGPGVYRPPRSNSSLI